MFLDPLKKFFPLVVFQVESVALYNESFMHDIIFKTRQSPLLLLISIQLLQSSFVATANYMAALARMLLSADITTGTQRTPLLIVDQMRGV